MTTKKPAKKAAKKRARKPAITAEIQEIREFRERLAALKARKAELWGANRNARAARMRRDDSFVGGSEAGRRKAMAKRGEGVEQ